MLSSLLTLLEKSSLWVLDMVLGSSVPKGNYCFAGSLTHGVCIVQMSSSIVIWFFFLFSYHSTLIGGLVCLANIVRMLNIYIMSCFIGFCHVWESWLAWSMHRDQVWFKTGQEDRETLTHSQLWQSAAELLRDVSQLLQLSLLLPPILTHNLLLQPLVWLQQTNKQGERERPR